MQILYTDKDTDINSQKDPTSFAELIYSVKTLDTLYLSLTCKMLELHVASCVHGYHVYDKTWTAALGEEFCCEQELGVVSKNWVL